MRLLSDRTARSAAAPALLLLLLLSSAMALAGCGGGDPCGDLSHVTYRGQAQFVVARNCVRCHDAALTSLAARNQAPTSHNYNTYTEVAKWADRMAERMVQLGDMPPGGGVSTCDKQIFRAWVDQGKLEK